MPASCTGRVAGTPVIFASEPGRYSEDGMMHKRLLSDDEEDDHAPHYDDVGGRKQEGTGDTNQNRQDGRTLPRQVPPYLDSRGGDELEELNT